MKKVVLLTTVMLVLSLSGCGNKRSETLRDMHNGIGKYIDIKSNDINNPLGILDEKMLYNMVASASDAEEKEMDRTIVVNVDGELNELELKEYTKLVKVRADNKDFCTIKELEESDIRLGRFVGEKEEPFAKVYMSLDLERIGNWCEELSNKYYIKYKAPNVNFKNGVKSVDMGVTGRSLDANTVKDEIYASIVNKTYRTDLNTSRQEANTTLEDLMAIQSKVSSFSTGYSSSGGSRKTNIGVAAKRLNGTLLLPGDVLSVDKKIGSRNASNGYAKAGSYLNGKTVQTYGGGVCQVSTTLYGAILRAGIIPIERNAHSMAVSYVPLGLDAAISEGYKDLKIENTYNTPIYIEAYANGSTLTFNIWGKENITDGKVYKPRSVAKSSLKAEAYLDVYDTNGNKIETKQLKSSNYKPHK